jgi:hypothetical protein
MTTLVEELERAVKDAEDIGRLTGTNQVAFERASRLRQRAARVRELDGEMLRTDKLPLRPYVMEFWLLLTGPIPSGTAPAAPCYCEGGTNMRHPDGSQCPGVNGAADPKEGSEKP